MKRVLLIGLAVVLVIGLIFAGCAKPAETTQESFEVTLLSMHAASTSYALAVVLVDDINKRSTWLKATAPEALDPMVSMKTLIEDPALQKNTFIFNGSGPVWLANKHEDQTAEPPFNTFDYNEFRPFFLHGIGGSLLCALDPNIKTLKDLDGKAVCIGVTAGDWKYPIWRVAIELAGATPKSYDFMTGTAATEALKDGLLDAVAYGSAPTANGPWAPAAGLPDLIAMADVCYIVPDKAYLEAASQELNYPTPVLTIPAGDLDPNQTKDLPVLSNAMWYGAHKSFPDEVVTEIMRVVWETCETWVEYKPALGAITRQTLGSLGYAESDYHPAALKFLKDKGVKITSWGNW